MQNATRSKLEHTVRVRVPMHVKKSLAKTAKRSRRTLSYIVRGIIMAGVENDKLLAKSAGR